MNEYELAHDKYGCHAKLFFFVLKYSWAYLGQIYIYNLYGMDGWMDILFIDAQP